jgi:small conductance mechanosensitive channel
LKTYLEKSNADPVIIRRVNIAINIVLVSVVVGIAAYFAGVPYIVIHRTGFVFLLVVTGLYIILRPLLPSLPFNVGDTVKVGSLLGKVEATSLINTRLKTFDGTTFFVPNTKILNEFVINNHYTGTRRVKINVGIGYDQDLLKAKQVLEAIMIEDPRVKVTPRPYVYVLNLSNSCVELGGRCWVDNLKFWPARCELLEKTKLRFDQENITFAFPQLDVHYDRKAEIPKLSKDENEMPAGDTAQFELG